MAGRGKRGQDVVGEIRGGLTRYFKSQEAAGRPVSTIWAELFELDPVGAMRLAISTMPKEMDITTTELTPEKWLELMADASKSESTNATEDIQGPVH
jgi:hypothetical protein